MRSNQFCMPGMLVLLSVCIAFQGCGPQPDATVSDSTKMTVDTPAVTRPDVYTVAATDLNADSLFGQCRDHSLFGNDDSAHIDRSFIVGDYRFALVTDNSPACHKVYLIAMQYDQIKRCAELENVGEPEPGNPVYQYKDLSSTGDTIFSVALVTQAITDTEEIDAYGRLKDPNIDVQTAPKVVVEGEVLPCMLLNDSIRDWPNVWKANPPFPTKFPG